MSAGETEGDVVRLRKRDVVGLLGCLVVGGAALVFAIGGTRWFSRHIAPVVYDLPGGSWTVGGCSASSGEPVFSRTGSATRSARVGRRGRPLSWPEWGAARPR